MITFSHNLLTGRHTTFDHHIVVLLGTQFDKTPLHGRIPAHHINISTTLLDDDRLLRHHKGILNHVKQQAHFRKLPGQEDAFGISARTENVPVRGSTCGSAKSTSPRYG